MQPAGQVPQVNYEADLYRRAADAPVTTVTGPLLQKCLTYTKEHGKYIFDPKFSFFLAGMRMMNHPESDWPVRGIEQIFGFFLTCASPVLGGYVVYEHAAQTAGGALATCAVAPIVGTELAARTAIQTAKTVAEPSDAKRMREHFTELFIDRMVAILQARNLAYHHKREVKENPIGLIGHAALEVAFLSRVEPNPTALRIGTRVLHRQEIYALPLVCQHFFDTLCEMKTAIQLLQVPQDENPNAWLFLSTLIDKVRKLDPQPVVIKDDETGEWVDLGSKKSTALTKDQEKYLQTLLSNVYAFSYYLSQDPLFLEQWGKRQI